MNSISKITLAGILSLTIPALAAADDGVDDEKHNGKYDVNTRTESSTPLDATEAAHLTFMREEEKLARDVYLKFAEWYPEQSVFSNIATTSEQTHTDTMRDRLAFYNIEDPNPETNNLPDSIGVFTGEEWSDYFDYRYAQLTEWGGQSELDALHAGALIEELDMHDIADCPSIMHDPEAYEDVFDSEVEYVEYPDPCGLTYTDETGLINAYSSLIDGSENHLRAYVGQIEAVNGYCSYEAQYLDQEEVDAILGRSCDDI